ncbi:origin recognition complex subunit 4 [Monosporozyma unispora]
MTQEEDQNQSSSEIINGVNKRPLVEDSKANKAIDDSNDDLLVEFDSPSMKRLKKEETIYSTTYVKNLLNNTNELLSKKPSDEAFSQFQEILLSHLNFTLPSKDTRIYSYLKDTHNEISRILKQSIIQKESHSVITVGPRNSFKSFLINHELNLLSEEYQNQFITIKLNGFIHSENAAINGIATQLEAQLQRLHGSTPNEKDETEGENFVDDEEQEESTNISSGSLTEVFEKILRLLDSASREKVSTSEDDASETTKITVVFVFDEIDTFAGPVRQTLLYNLFDMVEHARVPVCIFGNTTKLNILELLEKRVKSRFSQRIIYMPQINDLDKFKMAIHEQLTIPENLDLNKDTKYAEQWESFVKSLLEDEESKLFQSVKTNYETFKSLTTFRNGMIPLISTASSFEELKEMLVVMNNLTNYNTNQLQASFSARVKSLSNLELAILICAARTALKSKDEAINFNLAYVEYKSMVKAMNSLIPSSTAAALNGNGNVLEHSMKLWSKKDVKNVWETLQALDFLTDRSAVGLRESAIAVFYASNYVLQGTNMPFDLRIYHNQVTLQELRRIVPTSSIYYSWTQL